MILAVLVVGGFALAPSSQAPNEPESASSPTEQASNSQVTLVTNKGEIVIELFNSSAPKTVGNFLTKVTAGEYNGRLFHRVEDWVVQGGDPLGNGTGGSSSLPTELSSRPFLKGAVGVARGNDIKVSNDAQFFIVKTDAPSLNGQYTNFGQVKSGLEVVEKMTVGDRINSIRLN